MQIELEDIELQDLEDLLPKVAVSFGIQFHQNELADVATFGEFCDRISDKTTLEHVSDCTNEQAFQKLKNAVSHSLQIAENDLSPSTPLDKLFPLHLRRYRLKMIEKRLGFKLNLLRAPNWLIIFITIVFLLSLITLFFNGTLGVLGMAATISGLFIANKTGLVLDQKTLGDVAEKMTREQYIRSRNNPETFNRSEIEMILITWYSQEFELSNLTRESRFGRV